MLYAKLIYIFLLRDNDTTITVDITRQGDDDHRMGTYWDKLGQRNSFFIDIIVIVCGRDYNRRLTMRIALQ